MFTAADRERDYSQEEGLRSIEIVESSQKWDKKEYSLNIEIEKIIISIKD